MSKTIENQTKHLGLMGQAVQKLDSILSVNRLQAFLDAISLSRLKDISDGIESISSTGRNLTTELESTFQSNSRSMAAFGVTIGKTGAELKKFQKETNSAAYETGISIDQMGKAFYGFEPAAQILTDLGIKGGKDFAKFAEVAGVDAEKFGWGIGQMSKQLGLSSEQMNLLIGQATKFGQTTGTLGETLNSLPDMTELLNARKALGDSPEQITNFGQQIFGLGDALFNVGIKDAGGFAKHLAKTMTDSKKTFKDLFAGVGGDLSQFQTELKVSGLDAKKVFDAMEQGPADFMKVLAEQVDQLQKNGGNVGKALEFMRGRMNQTFGEEQTNLLVTALKDPVKRGAIAAIQTQTKATDTLGKIVAEGYKDRFTLAEHFERAEQMMVYRFRQIGREETKKFVKQSRQAFKQFGDSLEKIAKEKGPLGAFVRKMSEAHQIGAQAFIPEVMRPMVTLAGSAVKEMGPMLGVLGSLGFRFQMLLNPMNLVLIAGGALLAWFAALRLSGKTTDDALAEMGTKLMLFFYRIPQYVDDALDGLASLISGGSKSNVWTQVFDMVWNSIKSAAAHIWTRMKEIAAGFWDGFTGSVIAEDIKTPTQIIGEKLGAVLRGALDRAWANLKKGVMDLASGQATGEGVLAAVLGLGTLMKFAGPVLSVLSTVVSLVGTIGSAVASVASFLAPVVGALFTVEGVVLGVAAAFAGLVAGFMLWPTETQKAVDWVSGLLRDFSSKAAELVTGAVLDAVAWLFSGGAEGMAQWLGTLPGAFYGFLADLFPAIGKALTAILGMLESVVLGAFDGIQSALMSRFPESAETIKAVFDGIKDRVKFVFGVIKIVITTVSEVLGTVANFIGHVFTTAFNIVLALGRGVRQLFGAIWDWLSEKVEYAAGWWSELLEPAFAKLQKWMQEFWAKVQPYVQPVADFFNGLWNDIVNGTDRILKAVTDVFGGLRKKFDDFFGGIDKWADTLWRTPEEVAQRKAMKAAEVAAKTAEATAAQEKAGVDAAVKAAEAILAKKASAAPTFGLFAGATALSTPFSSGFAPPPDSSRKRVPAAAKPAPALSAEARDASLVSAVHSPMWYSRYEAVFAQRMDALIAAVSAGSKLVGVLLSHGGRSVPRTSSRGGRSGGDGSNLGLNGVLTGDVGGGVR